MPHLGQQPTQPSAWGPPTHCSRNGASSTTSSVKGAFSSNNVTAPWQPKDACWIVNHSPSFSPSGGSHWVACRVQGNKAFWLDSYGLPPHAQLENKLMGSSSDPHPHFDRWLKRMGVESVEYNDRDLQSVASEVCGLYACYFAVHGQNSTQDRRTF